MSRYVLSLLSALALLAAALYIQQEGLMFEPGRASEVTPQTWGMAFRERWLASDNDEVKLHAWYVAAADSGDGSMVEPKSGTNPVLLFFHGNAGGMTDRRASIEIFRDLGIDVAIIDYRGFGRSGGRPSEQGLYEDARNAWDWVTGSLAVDPRRVVLFGRSMGGAVAVHLASQPGVNPGALILESTFSSVRDYAHEVYPALGTLVPLRYSFDSAKKIADVAVPVLILHSRNDEVVPYALGRRLYALANAPKRFVDLRGGHNAGFLDSGSAYAAAIKEFLDEYVPLQDVPLDMSAGVLSDSDR